MLELPTNFETTLKDQPAPREKGVGLALGGGGPRGLAHIGVLKVLEREQIPITCLAGTSMGGLVGAAYAIGLSPQDLEAEALSLSHFRELIKLIDWKPGRRGLPGKRVAAYLADKLGDIITFADLSLPLALIAVDLISGQEVVLKEGRVVEAMRATMSLPSVFDPVEINGYQLVDGGLLNNVPADVARQLGAEIVIAVDVMPNFSPNKPGDPPLVKPVLPPGFMPIPLALWQKEQIMVSALTEARLEQAKPDLILRPDIPQGVTSLFGFSQTADIIASGEAATEAVLPRLHQLVRQSTRRRK